MRFVTNAATPSDTDVRRVEENGTEYLVAPGIFLREKIYSYPEDGSEELLPAEEISESVDRWNGQPIRIGHPTQGPAPEIGEFRNAEELDGGAKLRAEPWIDIDAATRHPDGRAIVTSIDDGDTLSVSPGYNLREFDDTPGRRNGVEYDGVQRGLIPDHVAVFPPDSAATARCLPSEGCALPRANASKTPMTDDPQSTDDRETVTDAEVDPDTLTQRVRDVLREMFTGEADVRANADGTESSTGDGDAESGGDTATGDEDDTSGDDAATTADAEDQSGDHADADPDHEDTVGDETSESQTGGDDTDPADAPDESDPNDTSPSDDPESASAESEPTTAELAEAESSATPDTVSTMNDAEKIDFLVEERGLDRENVAHLEGTNCLDDIYQDAKRTLEAEEESEDDQPDGDADAESESDGEGDGENAEADTEGTVTPEATETPESPETPAADADGTVVAERVNALESKLDAALEENESLKETVESLKEEVEAPKRERRQNAAETVADHLGISEESALNLSDDDLFEKAAEAKGQRANAQQAQSQPQATMAAVQTGVDRANAQDGPDDDEIARLMPGKAGYEARNGGDE